MSDTNCRRIIYQGRVQGVGFRWTVSNLAPFFAIKGYVRNLTDGSVEIVAEGEKEEIDRFHERIREIMQPNIKSFRIEEEKTQGFEGFIIKH